MLLCVLVLFVKKKRKPNEQVTCCDYCNSFIHLKYSKIHHSDNSLCSKCLQTALPLVNTTDTEFADLVTNKIPFINQIPVNLLDDFDSLFVKSSSYYNMNDLNNTGQHTYFAEDISTVLRYIRCADSENGLMFAELAVVFEINAFFMKILLT